MREYAQWQVDVLDLDAKAHRTLPFEEVVDACGERCIDMVSWKDPDLVRRSKQTGRSLFPWVLNFRKLLAQTPFVADMRSMLELLEEAYEYPVDVEFTANFLPDGNYRINLVQCRPFQVSGGGPALPAPAEVAESDLLLRTHGAVVGASTATVISRLIYVVPSVYGRLSQVDRYSIARLIGRITRLRQPAGALMLVGPGRWGTSEPSLGVPVSFAEISRVNVLCEVIEVSDGLVPDVSLGTHFFNDLVERNVLYLALVAAREGNYVNTKLIEKTPNLLGTLLPGEIVWAEAVRVIDPGQMPGGRSLRLHADALKQSSVIYFGYPR
jgi:hypothetical protein